MTAGATVRFVAFQDVKIECIQALFQPQFARPGHFRERNICK